ncbi:MAG TPA: response regulator transcription factor [Bryobacteraceae bacterium]|jgi:two-component system response regulator CpxR
MPALAKPRELMKASERAAILVVDDDVEMTEMLCEYLRPEGFAVEIQHDGDSGLKKALQGDYQLVVLDVMLPRVNGFEVLRRLRLESRVPVLMLTARSDSVDRVVGLQSGADDYLPKPFDPEELIARVRAILRRTAPASLETGESDEVMTIADLVLDSRARSVRRDGAIVELTAAEFDLLKTFLRSAGRVIGREELFRDVLGREFSVFDRSIDNHVSSLRKKLGPQPGGRDRIRAVRNAGYVYVAPEASPRDP